jgi:hypothetical protein
MRSVHPRPRPAHFVGAGIPDRHGPLGRSVPADVPHRERFSPGPPVEFARCRKKIGSPESRRQTDLGAAATSLGGLVIRRRTLGGQASLATCELVGNCSHCPLFRSQFLPQEVDSTFISAGARRNVCHWSAHDPAQRQSVTSLFSVRFNFRSGSSHSSRHFRRNGATRWGRRLSRTARRGDGTNRIRQPTRLVSNWGSVKHLSPA